MTENEAKWEYYRAIGLIERIKTEETHERYIDRHKAFDLAIQALKEIQQYRAIGTVEECRAAVDKTHQAEPVRNDKCTCPKCGTHNEVIKKRRNTVAFDTVYCWHCGQALLVVRDLSERMKGNA